jgi:hypothetical protein
MSRLILPFEASNNVAKIGTLSVWARNGIICLSHELPNGKEDFKQLSVGAAKVRYGAMNDELKRLRQEAHRHPKLRDQVHMLERFLSAMNTVIAKAEEQGPPENSDAIKDRLRRRKTQVSVPFTRADLEAKDAERGLK